VADTIPKPPRLPISDPYLSSNCIPTVGKAAPTGAEWFHEVKYDGYRLRVERDGDRVRLITRGGYEWSKRFPWIAEAALRNRRKQFVIDGEAVVLGRGRRRFRF
jgi:bifunctional non-homologous end joining protein LigD